MYLLLLISTVISINGYSGIEGTESVTDLLCDGKANDWVSLGDVP